MATIFDRLKSHEGRLSRQGYILGFAVPFLGVTALSSASFTGMIGEAASIVLQACALGWTVLLAFGDAMNIRRYHDIGNSGRLYRLCRPGIVILPLLAFAIQFLIPAQMASVGDLSALAFLMNQEMSPSMGLAPTVLLGITFAGVAINLIYLSLTPGQPGPNPYGPDPNNGVAAVPGAVVTPKRNEVDGDDDPVKRALAAYKREQAAPQQAHVQAARPAAAPRVAGPAGPGSFGKKRV